MLSSISATLRLRSASSTRREKSGGIVSTPLTRPLRRSVERLALDRRSRRCRTVRAPDATALASSRILHRRHAVILIDDRQLQVLDVAAEGVAEHDQLHEREDHRHDDQHRAAPEAPQLAFDDGQGSYAWLSPPAIMNGTVLRPTAPAARRAARGRCSARTRRPASCSGPTATDGDAGCAAAPSAPASSPGRCRRRAGRRRRRRHASTSGSVAALCPVGGVVEKLTSSMFLPGIDAFSFSGESSAISSP